jgi:glycerophosphoryl diester phosphodiesterase
VATADGVLVARHENELSRTTDVASRPRFADRRTIKVIDGVPHDGWFAEDLTLDEVRSLRAVERLPALRPGSAAYDGVEQVPTLEEVLALARRAGVGVYLETKHPSYFRGVGLPLEPPLLAALDALGWDSPDDPVLLESFELANLRDLRRRTGVRLVHLIGPAGAPPDLVAAEPSAWDCLTTPRGLAELATAVDGIGPEKRRVLPRDPDGRLLGATTLVADAHDAGLVVHPHTFRDENAYLALDDRRGDPADPGYPAAAGDAAAEYRRFADLGVDGVFSDHPATALAALRGHRARAEAVRVQGLVPAR